MSPSRTISALLFLTLAAAHPAFADPAQPQQLTVPSFERPVAVTYFAAPGQAKHPAVLIVHGVNGVTPESLPHFTRYAQALAAAGIDAYIVAYYSEADRRGMNTMEHGARAQIFNKRLGAWIHLIADVVSYALDQPDSSGKVGLLGLSNGGFLSVTESSLDPRVTALVVLYGGIPEAMQGRIDHLPPLLELHGDADRNIPVQEGIELVKRARALGEPVEQKIYSGEGHGFDADPTSSDAQDAVDRTVAFMVKTLK
jgi:carboxymethylenebutenolidase